MQIVRQAIEDRITHAEAAEIIGLDLRQVQRIVPTDMQLANEVFAIVDGESTRIIASRRRYKTSAQPLSRNLL